MDSKITLEDVWTEIEKYGINRKILESTNPSNELLFHMCDAIVKITDKMAELEKSKFDN